MPEIIQKFVAQPAPFMRSRNKARDIQEFNRHRSSPIDTTAVVGLAFVRQIIALACAIYLKVTDRALGIDGRET